MIQSFKNVWQEAHKPIVIKTEAGQSVMDNDTLKKFFHNARIALCYEPCASEVIKRKAIEKELAEAKALGKSPPEPAGASVRNEGKAYNTGVRDGLLKIADQLTIGNKPLFDEIREIINAPHILPQEEYDRLYGKKTKANSKSS